MDSESLNPQTQHLAAKEIANPMLVIADFFNNYTLPECRALLRETLHQALSGYPTRDGIHPADLLRFLEELEKAAEAMYNIALNHPHPPPAGDRIAP